MDNQNPTPTPEPTPTPTPTPAVSTPPQAANVDIDAIVSKAADKAAEVAQSRMEGTFKSMLKQSGLDADTIAKITAEWQAKQVTPEQTIAQLQGDVSARDVELAALKQEKILRNHGLTDDEDIEVYGIRINKLVTDGKTFEQAAQEYFEAHPRKQKASASATNSGTGRTSMTATELDNLKADYEKARKQNNSAKMVEIRMLAKQKGYKFD